MIPREKLWHLRILPVLFPTHNIITEIMNYTRQRLRGKQICWWMKKQKKQKKKQTIFQNIAKNKKKGLLERKNVQYSQMFHYFVTKTRSREWREKSKICIKKNESERNWFLFFYEIKKNSTLKTNTFSFVFFKVSCTVCLKKIFLERIKKF